jgi:hypothetical protein
MLWDEQWQAEKPRLNRLSGLARVRFAAACVDRAFWRLSPTLEASIVRDRLPVLRRGLELLWRIAEGTAEPDAIGEQLSQTIRALQALEPDEDSPELAVHGWDELLYALLAALRCARGPEERVSAAEVADHAYQAVWFQRVYPQTNQPLPMEAMNQLVRQLELNDPVCRDDLAFQVECLRRVEAGEAVPRSTPPLDS